MNQEQEQTQNQTSPSSHLIFTGSFYMFRFVTWSTLFAYVSQTQNISIGSRLSVNWIELFLLLSPSWVDLISIYVSIISSYQILIFKLWLNRHTIWFCKVTLDQSKGMNSNDHLKIRSCFIWNLYFNLVNAEYYICSPEFRALVFS